MLLARGDDHYVLANVPLLHQATMMQTTRVTGKPARDEQCIAWIQLTGRHRLIPSAQNLGRARQHDRSATTRQPWIPIQPRKGHGMQTASILQQTQRMRQQPRPLPLRFVQV
jgi:hypothetical protein